MSMATSKLRNKLSKLHDSLDKLEGELEPLLAQPLAESLVVLDTIQQAKLQVVIPYVVYDLVFVYLKTRGIDPTTHPVVTELDRVRQYFEKIKKAEGSVEKKRKAAVDRQAAGRFIKHALAQAQTAEHEGEDEREQEQEQERGPGIEPEPQDGGQSSAAGSSTERVPIKMTSKMLARAEYEQSLRELDDEEEDDLAVFDEDAGVDAEVEEGYQPMEDVDGGLVEPAKDKGKQRMLVGVADESGANQVTTSRRKRPRIDPFTGEDISPASVSTDDQEKSTSIPTGRPSIPGHDTPGSLESPGPRPRSSKKKSKGKAKKS